ncbi:PKD domain-containing protein [Lentzea flaviverrucosa]|uniref:Regulator of chromosome condensation (RCC1) repeat-containing protein n=1 Tax=Lentzea flaviverrucosa TaxID=200379 RepID=A0A1H9XT08_9PSEU|nr:PKD domain-containing protein [Lentzea flaviverrucosa]RDI19241.1 Regulator of Chromosome Condensation (RCC1) repeat protein [Lentzea flaviverrucosa]SES49300.1 Regulator of chromosome condensation (RCC1) repeat-containing protein [Lentzea flaviverrucosa]
MKRRARLLGALTAVATAATAVLVVGPGYDAAEVRMHSGTVWLASARTGEVTLVNGAAAEVVARVPVAAPDTDLTVTQRDGSAVVLDRKTGLLSGVDGASERVTPAGAALAASDGLVVLPSPKALHVVDVHSGMSAAVDPATLAPRGEPVRLAGSIRPGNAAVDEQDRVWAVDDSTGDVVWLEDGRRRTHAATKNARLTITGGWVALVDPDRGTAGLLDPATGAITRSVRLGVPAGDELAIGGTTAEERLLVAIGSSGELVSCTFGTGCASPVKVSAAGAELGKPVEVGGHAVVPDLSTGQATIVDLVHSRVVAQRQLFDQPVEFELIAHDDVVFFNDPGGDTAGVLDLTGGVRTITKYTREPVRGDVRPSPDPRAQADPAKKIDRREGRHLGLPGQTGQPSPPTPGAPPAASIVVSPRSHGVVGEEFELTMVSPSASAAPASWSFGDDAPAGSGTTVRHSWQRTGSFTVRATASLDGGGTAQAETTVTITEPGAPPSITRIAVQRPKPVIGELVRFGAETTGRPDSWRWTVTRTGSATPEATAGTAEFDHRFSSAGAYTVSLIITTGTATSRSSREVTVARGAVRFWGRTIDVDMTPPESVSSGVIAIDAGGQHALALKADGSVIAWGSNYSTESDVPEEALSGVVAIAAGYQHSLALKADGSVLAWGISEYGVTDVPPDARHDVIAIAAGVLHSVALKRDGSLVAWGVLCCAGQWSWTPPPSLTGATAIAVGGMHSMAVRADGTVVSWGDTSQYTCDPPAPMHDVRTVAGGYGPCLALRTDGTLTGWGLDNNGPFSVPPAAQHDVVAVDAHVQHVLVLKTDGSVIGWGLDMGYPVSPVPPVPAELDHGVIGIAAGGSYGLVLLE